MSGLSRPRASAIAEADRGRGNLLKSIALVTLGVLVTVAVQLVEVERSSGLFGFAGENANALTTATLHPPGAVSVSDPQQTSLEVEWTASASAFVAEYQLYRSTDPGGPYAPVGGPVVSGTLSLSDTGLDPATTYFYVVRAMAENWVSVDSVEAQGTTLP